MPERIKAVFFDFMGTCLDWHTGAVSALPPSLPAALRSELALRWRQRYFDSNAARLRAAQPPEDIDVTLRATLAALVRAEYPEHAALFTEACMAAAVARWHAMPAWPEVAAAVAAVQAAGFETFVFANGTPRLQLDLCASSGLRFGMLFSSALLGVYKPAPQSYRAVLDHVKVRADQSVMVAAHAYDLRGAKEQGMRTVYVRRWTDDVLEDPDVVKRENDYFLEDMSRLPEVVAEMDAE